MNATPTTLSRICFTFFSKINSYFYFIEEPIFKKKTHDFAIWGNIAEDIKAFRLTITLIKRYL